MAPLPIRYRLACVTELDEATKWYSQYGQALANQFRQIVRDKITEARRFPRHWPAQSDGTRHIYLAPFPYVLVVRVFKGFLEVIALAHTSRQPGYWRDRLR